MIGKYDIQLTTLLMGVIYIIKCNCSREYVENLSPNSLPQAPVRVMCHACEAEMRRVCLACADTCMCFAQVTAGMCDTQRMPMTCRSRV